MIQNYHGSKILMIQNYHEEKDKKISHISFIRIYFDEIIIGFKYIAFLPYFKSTFAKATKFFNIGRKQNVYNIQIAINIRKKKMFNNLY
jgi:hypothetical protein